jgi:hypothetical protein
MKLPSRRQWSLIALMPGAMLVGAATDQQSGASGLKQVEEVVEPMAPSEKPRLAGVPDLPHLDLAALRRPGGNGEPRDAFESKSWYVPPPPPPPPPPRVEAPPPAPTAPPLPFTYFGRYKEAEKPVILLMLGERLLVVREGEVIDGIYKVEGLLGRTLTITYLPLNIKQTLNVEPAG